ncbi:MAG TPA: type II toxin-antitoxin system ParD family antitoxin [Blastocatellia bacterium]|nr:type II toxin-antitoxin system ParD family antitoxin [Blastocatellia bacterium]HMV81659.1 type II toxin-antitoxin system ParD family antitoxin [Blastocatellia bacterium]HMX26546.1 type II toxin-antitoxin system ParD family antitoxin [Blastocatellia bacterium]HMZ20260.1 type II toxin-antitoxin system ParD family antitoxin [Blastocatellia bacterium]HNG32147.1 type II toxin-antitoxin system ParD family antitoxin [Blastocatellia bacterium]
MATMNISLPDILRVFVEERVAEGGYGTTSEYFRELVRKDQKRQAEEKLEALLLDGLNSGPAKPLTKADLDEVRRVVRERVGQKRKSAA